MSKIETLTPEQIAKLPLYRDKWLKIGLSTEPTDKETAERGVDLAYRAAGLEPPKIKIWLRNPLEGCIGAFLLCQVWGQVWGQVRDQVGDQVWGQVRDQVWGQVRDQVRGQVRGQIYLCGCGLHDAGWLAFYDFFYMETEVKSLDKLEGLWLLSQSCGWWWPFEHAVILTEKPVFLSRDQYNRLHCADKAAISYSDGWGICCWHGVVVPEWIITNPTDITIGKIDQEQNQEIKRVLLERFGEGRYLEESGAELLSEDRYGKLYRKDVGQVEPLVYVRVENSTPETDGSRKIYWLRVPPACKTPHEAVAWTFGLTPETYQPLQET